MRNAYGDPIYSLIKSADGSVIAINADQIRTHKVDQIGVLHLRDQAGNFVFTRAQAAATWGLAMEVPFRSQ